MQCIQGKGKAYTIGEGAHIPHCVQATSSRMEDPTTDIIAVGTVHISDTLT